MKRIFTLVALMTLLVAGINAQEKKSWDFTQGLSDETIANLNADAANWTSNGQDADGNTNNWKNAVNQGANGYWQANGVVIEELRGLLIDIGKNKDNSVHLATTKLRLTRKGTKITFPKLANGQKITIQGRSANGTANNRGIAPVQNYIQFQAEESSPQTGGACIFLGNQVEGSEGTYTFVWKVVTEGTDSVDVQFQLTPDAGIDFTFFMIDQGDAPALEEARKVAYLGTDADLAYQFLSSNSLMELTTLTEVPTLESLAEQEVLVIGAETTAEQAEALKPLVAFFPIVNLNPALSETFGMGTVTATETTTLTLTEGAFENLAETLEYAEPITGITLNDYSAKDAVLGKAGDVVAIHAHNQKRNAYYMVPADNGCAELWSDLVPQVVVAAAKTKKDVAAVGTPVITYKQEDGVSIVSITATNSKAIYYTTDGTDPTTASTLYTEPFELTADATVKAMATGDGYTDSEIGSKEVKIATKLAAPTIAIAKEQGKSTVTITAAEGAKVYYNFNGAKTSALSQAYTEPVELTEPAIIYVLAEAENMLPSDLASEEVAIDGIDKTNIRLDVLAHFDANQTDWLVDNTEEGGTGNASAYYYWGKSAWNYYSDEVDHEETVKDSEGNDSIVYVYKPNPEALRVINPNNENGWVLKSEGQVLTGELTLAPGEGVGNGATGRFAEEAADFMPAGIDNAITKGVITFGGKTSGEPYTGRIETTGKLQGPFDVVVFCGNGNNGEGGNMEIQTSEDGETWTTLAKLNMAGTQRYIKRTKASYEETGEVYLRVAHISGSTKAQVYDIYVLNNGEKSQQYGESGEADGIHAIANSSLDNAIYDIGGMRQQGLQRGLNIVIENGVARKVLKK